jgi:hypothetical protein
MIGRESLIATPLRPGNVIKVINVLSLPLYLKSLFKCLKRYRSIIINSNKLTVIKYSLSNDWGSTKVFNVGNANVEFNNI